MKSELLLTHLLEKYPLKINTKQFCELTGDAKSTVEQARLKGNGCPYLKTGKSVRYFLPTVVDWIARNEVRHTAEATERDRRQVA